MKVNRDAIFKPFEVTIYVISIDYLSFR